MAWSRCGRRRAGKLTGLAGLSACVVGKIPSRPSSDAPLTPPKPKNGRGVNGPASCGTPPRTSRFRRRWIGSFSARVASMRAPLGSLDAWGEGLHAKSRVEQWAPPAALRVGYSPKSRYDAALRHVNRWATSGLPRRKRRSHGCCAKTCPRPAPFRAHRQSVYFDMRDCQRDVPMSR